MIPYSYNMVDMGGIDLAEANGTVVPGVYERITEAMNLCGDLILYDWKFAGINIAPSACSILQQLDSVLINGLIQVTELDEITVLGIEPPPPPILPVIPLEVTENGIYEISPPQSGYNPVTVNVQSVSIEPNALLRVEDGYFELSNWTFNNADDFDWVYKNLEPPNTAYNWPTLLDTRINPSSAIGSNFMVQGNYWNSRKAMNIYYCGQYTGDSNPTYESPFDYDNFYKLSKRGRVFTLYKGQSVAELNTVAFQYTFQSMNDSDLAPIRIFNSNNHFSVLLMQFVGYDSQGNIIHNYIPSYDGKLFDTVDEIYIEPIGKVFSVII